MNDLIELFTYCLRQVVIFFFALDIGGVSVGSLLVAFGMLTVIFTVFVGVHTAVLSAANRVYRSDWRQEK